MPEAPERTALQMQAAAQAAVQAREVGVPATPAAAVTAEMVTMQEPVETEPPAEMQLPIVAVAVAVAVRAVTEVPVVARAIAEVQVEVGGCV
jgi:hypothetical protein